MWYLQFYFVWDKRYISVIPISFLSQHWKAFWTMRQRIVFFTQKGRLIFRRPQNINKLYFLKYNTKKRLDKRNISQVKSITKISHKQNSRFQSIYANETNCLYFYLLIKNLNEMYLWPRLVNFAYTFRTSYFQTFFSL